MSHEQNNALIEALARCAAECSHCASACLDEDDVKMMVRCIKLDIDCSEICQLAISYVSRGSEHVSQILKACSEICSACAEECEKHADHMDHCRRCAEVCWECAEACESGVAA